MVPHLLQKTTRVKICQENLKILSNYGYRIISKIITSDETYVHYYDAPTNQESKIWLDELPPIQLKQKQTEAKA